MVQGLTLGKNIRKYRIKNNMSQVQLASKLVVANSFICDIEKGRSTPSMKLLKRIAEILEVEIKELFE